MAQIKEKHVLVTGGASGLGAGNVQALLEKGAKAIVIFDTNEEGAKSTVEFNNKSYPGKVTFIKCDVSNDDDLTRAFNQALAKLNRIDVIINNAGILNDTLDQWFSTVDVNLKGVISLTRKGVSHMSRDTGGSGGTIINVASTAAFLKLSGVPVYSATKSGVLQFTRCVSCGDFNETTGVRMMTICYGATDTGIYQHVDKNGWDERTCRQLREMKKVMSLQKVETAAQGVITMLENGANGSIWLSQHGDPVEDITSIVEDTYENMCKALNLII